MKNNFKFKHFNYEIRDILTKADISLAVNKFYNEEIINIEPNRKFSILFKIKTGDGEWRSISSLQTTNKSGLDEIKDIFNIFWMYKSDIYKGLIIEKIVFRYILLDLNLAPEKSIFQYPTEFDKTSELMPEGYTNLPNNRIFETWGNEIVINGDNTFSVIKDNHVFNISQFDNEYYVTLQYKDKKLFHFQDIYDLNDKSNNTFIRTIDRTKLYYHNGVCNYLTQDVISKFIKKKISDIAIKDNFITMDLETRTINNIMHVISASLYDGNKIKSYYISDFNDSDELLKESITYLLQRKYNGYRVYIHNFSRFDAAFILRIMANMTNCEIKSMIKRDNKIINIKVEYNLKGVRKYSIYFRDSLLILPSKLKDLGKNFSVDVVKSIYPYKFVNDINISMNYIGKIPGIECFDDLKKEEYTDYCNKFENNIWSLRDETVKYCENDVKSLYLIIKEFQIKIFRLFEADINKYPTLSSLAFAIYRMRYLKDYQIPCITGEIYKNLKKSYTGGSVDVYIPVGENVNRYDVNSLYPAVMSEFPSPVGKITKFKGDILKYQSNPFGFFLVNIKTPENLHIPILQTRVKNKNGVRTISPLGEWSGWYFSEEILNAQKYGYKVEIIWGYLFEKQYIFKEFVHDLYELKKKSKKNTPDYTISKLLLNSLYGRFGMSPDKETNIIVKGNSEIDKYIKLNNDKRISIKDVLKLDEDVELISYTNYKEDEEHSTFDNISVSIASSITSYARIKMAEIKIKYSNNIYYSDTDSIDLDITLPDKYISNKLGDFKFEHEFKKIVYIAPKVYATIIERSEKYKPNTEYIVIKGYKDKTVSYEQIAKLVNENENLKLKHEKWYSDLCKGEVRTKEDTYTLMATESKRKLIYENNKLVRTTPYKLINDELV